MKTSNETMLKCILNAFKEDEYFLEIIEDDHCYAIIFKDRIYTKNFNLLKKINNEFFVYLFNKNIYLTIYKQ